MDIDLWADKVEVTGSDADNDEECNPEEGQATVKMYWAKETESEVETVPDDGTQPEKEEGQDKTEDPDNAEFDYENADAAVLVASWNANSNELINLKLDLTQMTGFADSDVTFNWKMVTEDGARDLSADTNQDTLTSVITRGVLPEDVDENFEIVCEIVVTNEKGEKLTITIKGFQLEERKGNYKVILAEKNTKENEA